MQLKLSIIFRASFDDVSLTLTPPTITFCLTLLNPFHLNVFATKSFVSPQILLTTRGSRLEKYCRPQPLIRCQFHQHFSRSFYARRSQKRKKYSQAVSIFGLLGSALVKTTQKTLVKLIL